MLDLHEHGAIDLDTPLGRLVSEDTLASLAPLGASAAGSVDIFIGTGYVFATYPPSGHPTLSAVSDAAGEVREATGQSASPATTFAAASAGSYQTLGAAGLINLEAPLRSLLGP
jgi:hypothetical protein